MAYGFKNTSNIASKKEINSKMPLSNNNKNPFLKKNNKEYSQGKTETLDQ